MTKEYFLEILAQGVQHWNDWRDSSQISIIDLSKVNL